MLDQVMQQLKKVNFVKMVLKKHIIEQKYEIIMVPAVLDI